MTTTISISDDHYIWLNNLKQNLVKKGKKGVTYDDILEELKLHYENSDLLTGEAAEKLERICHGVKK